MTREQHIQAIFCKWYETEDYTIMSALSELWGIAYAEGRQSVDKPTGAENEEVCQPDTATIKREILNEVADAWEEREFSFGDRLRERAKKI